MRNLTLDLGDRSLSSRNCISDIISSESLSRSIVGLLGCSKLRLVDEISRDDSREWLWSSLLRDPCRPITAKKRFPVKVNRRVDNPLLT